MVERAPRVGLVLGAGGVAALAYHSGVLSALADETGWDARTASIVVGTSAGSIIGTYLRAGISADDLFERAIDGDVTAEGALLLDQVGSPTPPPAWRPAGRPRPPSELAGRLARVAARPLAARPLAVLAGLMPAGTLDTGLVVGGIGGLFDEAWPDQPLWICTVRERDGRLVVLGREHRPRLSDAIAASCSIPGFFRPVPVGGELFVDGGVHSPTNADVLADPTLDLDLVVVSSPMSVAGRGPRLTLDQPARRWSQLLLEAESRRLRRSGTAVLLFQPTAHDADAMGPDGMDLSLRAPIARLAKESTLRRLARTDVLDRLRDLVG